MKKEDYIKKWQRRIFAACIIAYTAAYICRVNFSVAILGIQTEFGLSNTSIGLISTSFFWVYALGQLINGYFGDIISSRAFIFTGLILSALINVAFGYSSILWVMMLLWGANGIFQSMLWGPIVKTLSNWFPNKMHNKIAFGMSITIILGYLIAWSSSGLIMNSLSWRWVFWLAAIIVIILAFVWYIMVRNKPSDVGLADIIEVHANDNELRMDELAENSSSKKISLLKVMKNSNMIFIVLAGIVQGIIKESILLWSPKLLLDTQNLSLKSIVAIVLIIPGVNILGILLSGWLNRMLKNQEKLTIMILMLGSAITSLGLIFFIHKSTTLTILMLACTSAFIFGTNPLMTTVIPFKYSYCNKVSTMAGIIDFSIYLGAGLAGVLTGLTVDMFGWENVFIMWCIVSVLGALSMYTSILRREEYSK